MRQTSAQQESVRDSLPRLFLAELCDHKPAPLRALFELADDPMMALQAGDGAWAGCGIDAETRARLRQGASKARRHPAWRRAERQGELLRQRGARVVSLGSRYYPPLLSEIHDPPPLLYVAGRVEALLLPQFAIVGSRRSTPAGERAASEFAGALTGAGFSICSGMALGIDASAHTAALGTGGSTVAVMGTGIDQCYPRRHAALAAEIARSGALVTEFPPGTPPRREHFPQRNRIISGMSVGVLVAEASLKSGSLITAHLAADQNREVFAVPHSIFHPGGKGCLQLLREGAFLAESIDDLLEDVGSLCRWVSRSAPLPEPPPSAAGVWRCLGYEPQSVDGLVAAGAGDTASVMAALAELELAGLVAQRSGLYMRCV